MGTCGQVGALCPERSRCRTRTQDNLSSLYFQGNALVLAQNKYNETKDQTSSLCKSPRFLLSGQESSALSLLQRCSFSAAPVLSIPPWLTRSIWKFANSPNSLTIIPSGLSQVPGQLTCFHLRHLSSQPLAKSSVSMSHQLPAFGETIRNPRCQPPAALHQPCTVHYSCSGTTSSWLSSGPRYQTQRHL